MRVRTLAAASGMVGLLVAGCAPQHSSSSAAPGPQGSASGAQAVRLVLPHGTIFTVGLPYFVAQQEGFFKDHGVSVTPTFTAGGGTNVQAVIGGNADIGVETGPAALFSAYLHGAPVKIVAASTTGLDILLFSKGTGPYGTLKSLAGQKVGYSEPGSSSEIAVEEASSELTSQGLAAISAQPIGSPPDQLTAVETGQIAAGWTIPPTFLDKVASGKLRIAVNSFAAFPAYKNVVGRVTFTSSSFLTQHRAAVRGFLAAWHEAWVWSFAHQDQAIAIWKQAAHLTSSDATLKEAFSYYTLNDERSAPLTGINRDVADAVRFKLIDKALTATQLQGLVDTGLAPTS